MSRVLVSDLRWPIIVVRFPEYVSDEEYYALFEEYKALSQRARKEQVKLGYLIDFTKIDPVFTPAIRRQAASKVFREHQHHLELSTCAEARVISRTVSRAILTAFDIVVRQNWPCKNFMEEDDALRWLDSKVLSV